MKKDVSYKEFKRAKRVLGEASYKGKTLYATQDGIYYLGDDGTARKLTLSPSQK